MDCYRVLRVRRMPTGGVEAAITGPGTSDTGVLYWFETEDEACSFAENLNLSYREGKRLAARRKERSRKRLVRSLRVLAAH